MPLLSLLEISQVSIHKNEHNAYRPLFRKRDFALMETVPAGIRSCSPLTHLGAVRTQNRCEFTHSRAHEQIFINKNDLNAQNRTPSASKTPHLHQAVLSFNKNIKEPPSSM